MWCDEAESSINALTILQHGYPTSSYLGLPIYENCLTDPWPENAEYEFRDSSYSKQGVAVYHGWLPLYVIAGSLKTFGIQPATDASNLVAKCTPADIKRMTLAARAPMVFFGVGFLFLLYVTSREMYGRDAAWSGLLAASIAVPVVHTARQARYYSITLFLCTACCLTMWRLYKRGGRWRDYVAAAITVGLLFHTHVLTCFIACASGALLLPWLLKRDGEWKKVLTAGAILALFVIPWGALSGFFTAAGTVPKASSTMHLPQDLFIYAMDRWPVALFLALGTFWIAIVHYFGHRLPDKVTKAFAGVRGSCAFLIAWCVIGWLAFMLLIPAASLWITRAYLGALGPGIVLGAILFAGIGRVIGKRYSIPIGCALFCAFILANTRATYTWQREGTKSNRIADLIARMRMWELRPGTRVYCTPSDQLTLTFYTGVPVQSVAAVRKSWFDTFPNDIVVIESFNRFAPVAASTVEDEAAKCRVKLTDAQQWSWARRLTARNLADAIRPHVAHVNVPFDELPPFAQSVLERQKVISEWYSDVSDNPTGSNPSIFRGYPMPNYSLWWQVFFYRFVDFQNRSGERVNYLARLKNARATVLPSSFVIYHSPGVDPEKPIATVEGERR